MRLSLIAAMTDEGVIGFQNRLPWHLPEDLKNFKKITMGKPVIMGRKTYESIGKPLPGRKNIVLTRNTSFQAEGVTVVASLDQAIEVCKKEEISEDEIFVIGGAQIYQEALPRADRLYLTKIHQSFKGDAYFPEIDLEKSFQIVEKSDHVSADPEKLSYTFITAERINR